MGVPGWKPTQQCTPRSRCCEEIVSHYLESRSRAYRDPLNSSITVPVSLSYIDCKIQEDISSDSVQWNCCTMMKAYNKCLFSMELQPIRTEASTNASTNLLKSTWNRKKKGDFHPTIKEKGRLWQLHVPLLARTVWHTQSRPFGDSTVFLCSPLPGICPKSWALHLPI